MDFSAPEDNNSDNNVTGAEAATLSEDGTTITWKIPSTNLNLGGDNDTGFQVTIEGSKPTPPRWEMEKMSPRW